MRPLPNLVRSSPNFRWINKPSSFSIEKARHFLVNVLQFVRIWYTTSQKVGERRANIIQQLLAGIGIALLQTFHQACA